MIIDFHTHIFPDKIAKRTIEVLEENIYKTDGVRQHAVLDGTLAGLKQSMQDNSIDLSVIMPIATTTTQSNSINSFAASISGTDGIISFGSMHPMQGDLCETLENIKEQGLLGIKLHPEYQGVYIDSPECIRVLQKCEQLGLLVTLHTGSDIGIAPPVHCTPERLKNALSEVDGSNIIAAHMGGWRMWDDVEKYLVGTNINLDTSFCVGYLHTEQFLRILKNHKTSKIIHATDSPWEKQGVCAEFIKSLPLSDLEKDNILSSNAKKLLNLV